MSIGPLEAFWIVVNGTAWVLTVIALWDALQLRDVGPGARRLVARGNARREALRFILQSLLLWLVAPELFIDREIRLSQSVMILIAISLVLLLATVLDAKERRSLRRMTFEEIEAERDSALARIEEAVAQVGVDAKAAYEEANTVNQKIDARTTAIAQGEDVDHLSAPAER